MGNFNTLVKRSKDLIIRFTFINTSGLSAYFIFLFILGWIYILVIYLKISATLILYFIIFSVSFIFTNFVFSRLKSDSYNESFLYFKWTILNILAILVGIILFYLVFKHFIW